MPKKGEHLTEAHKAAIKRGRARALRNRHRSTAPADAQLRAVRRELGAMKRAADVMADLSPDSRSAVLDFLNRTFGGG